MWTAWTRSCTCAALATPPIAKTRATSGCWTWPASTTRASSVSAYRGFRAVERVPPSPARTLRGCRPSPRITSTTPSRHPSRPRGRRSACFRTQQPRPLGNQATAKIGGSGGEQAQRAPGNLVALDGDRRRAQQGLQRQRHTARSRPWAEESATSSTRLVRLTNPGRSWSSASINALAEAACRASSCIM